MTAIEEKGGAVYLHVRLQPKASRNSIHIDTDGPIRIAVTAPPVDGEANRALCEFIAKLLDLPKRQVSLIRGEKSREKTLRIEGRAAGEILARLHQGLPR